MRPTRLAGLVGSFVVLLLASPAQSFAYPVPSGLGSNTSLCAPRGQDTNLAYADPQAVGVTASLTQSIQDSGTVNLPAGTATFSIDTAGESPQAGAYAILFVQDSGGNWDRVAYLTPSSGAYGMASQVVQLPGGPTKIRIGQGTGSTQTVDAYLSNPYGDIASDTLVQMTDDACQLNVLDAAAAHTDSVALDGDVQALGPKLSTLDSDVKQLDADVNSAATQAHTDATSGSCSGCADVDVKNWPADQSVGLDTASAAAQDGQFQSLHDDLWILVGVIVGCWLFGIVLRKAWP